MKRNRKNQKKRSDKENSEKNNKNWEEKYFSKNNKTIKEKIIINEIVKSLFILLIALIIIIVGYAIKTDPITTIWWAASMIHISIVIIWLCVRLGLFSTSAYGTRKLMRSLEERKIKKLGGYTDEKPKDPVKYPKDLEKNNATKSWQGLILSAILSITLLVIAIIIYFCYN